MVHSVSVIPGDGTGPELVEAAVRVLEASGATLRWREVAVGAHEMVGADLPGSLIEELRSTAAIFKGPISTIPGGGGSPNVALRRQLGLFAQVRPVRSYPISPTQGVDVIIIRQTSEGLYAGVGFPSGSEEAEQVRGLSALAGRLISPGSGVSVKGVSPRASHRIFEFAFRWAAEHGRMLVTAVHKANVMQTTDGVFLRAGREIAADYPRLRFSESLVDHAALQLVRDPKRFDVIVALNLYGDILSDLTAGLVGGLGLAPGANFGESLAMFEAAHGSSPRNAGRNRMNPLALVLSGEMMLRYLGEVAAADRVRFAVDELVAEGDCLTYDLLSQSDETKAASTTDVADELVRKLRVLTSG